ncbi:terminase small subunit [Mameliella sediminis]|uniref:terminase small subunit n=1 Tax=Mameliella sediminis TaxID=2836866 RepID=UPI001C49794A|nr:terminase small subunit [Mameliella sediminis]MBV7394115.1 terminase small subunit [Mameliella sediminis]
MNNSRAQHATDPQNEEELARLITDFVTQDQGALMPILPNTRHEAFAQARVAGMTIDAAYVEAGYKANRSNAARMNANEHIRQRIRELQDAAAEQAEMTAAQVLEEIGQIAFSDIRELFDQDGHLLPVEAMPENAAKAIQSIKVSSMKVPGSEAGETVITTEIKFWDKNAALDRLFQYFGLHEQAQQADPLAGLVDALMKSARPLPVATDNASAC